LHFTRIVIEFIIVVFLRMIKPNQTIFIAEIVFKTILNSLFNNDF
jgi:hypothetical protein